MQIGMIDTIEVSFDVTDYDKVFEEFLPILEHMKIDLQQRQQKDFTDKNGIEVNGVLYEIQSNGRRNYAYILHSSSFEIRFAKGRSRNDNFHPIFIKAKSCALWNKSPELVCSEMKDIIRIFANDANIEIRERVKRVDLCCHTDKFTVTDDTIKEFLGSFRKTNIIRNGEEIETFGIASRKNSIYCRIYNKTVKVAKSRNEIWFNALWKKSGFDISKVWNIEFELHRDFLNQCSINTFDDLFSNIKGLWLHCTQIWLQHKNFVNTRIENSPVSKEWQKIQSVFDNYKGKSYITKKEQSELNAEKLVSYIVGYMTTFASYFDNMDIHTALDTISKKGELYLNNKGTDFENVISQKRLYRKGVAQ